MRNIMLAAALAAFIPGAAMAADISSGSSDSMFPVPQGTVSWSSIYIGAHGGYGNTNHNLNADATVVRPEEYKETSWANPAFNGIDEIDASAFLDGINGHGFFGGLSAGADLQRGNFVFGIFGQYDFSNVDTKAGFSVVGYDTTTDPITEVDRIDGTVSVKEGDSWLVGGRLGYVFNGRTLLYVLGGYGETDFKYDTDKRTVPGWTAGGGAEFAITKNVSFNLEYQHTFYDEETLISGNDLTLTDDIDADKVMAGLKIKLNAGLLGR